MHRLGVLGWPVAHSRSPAMHNAALQALGMMDWRYQALPVPEQLFTETTRALGQAGFVGANVTIPHKQAALALAEQSSVAARAIGAANTLTFAPDGTIAAENTDAPGLIAALDGLVDLPARPSALVLGAGGSARAAAWALREAGAREVSVWNRTPARAERLARELGVRAVSEPVRADLLVNCTSVGLERAGGRGGVERSASEPEGLNQLALTFDQVGEYSYVIDMVYRAGLTPLLAAAREHGARTLDGLEILLAQGALSFELWTGRAAPLEVMRRAARGPEDDSERGPAWQPAGSV
jgi:shikimate dehydrogenase